MLEQVYALGEEISMFLEMKGQENFYFKDPVWIAKLDLTTHMNNLNIHLQGKNRLVFELFGQITTFTIKFQLLESQLQK